jgi:hypothetical protein
MKWQRKSFACRSASHWFSIPVSVQLFFEPNGQLLTGRDANLFSFFTVFNEAMMSGCTDPVVTFDHASIRNAVLLDKSQEYSPAEIQ